MKETVNRLKKRFELTDEDMKRLDAKGIESLIKIDKSRLTVWSLPNFTRKEIEEEIKDLEELLKLA